MGRCHPSKGTSMTDKKAMAMALDALTYKKWFCLGMGKPNDPRLEAAITALKERLAQEPVQYKCTVIDNQHPNGIPLEQWVKPPQRTEQEFILHDEENEGGWSDWVCPNPDSYLMKCCDCGLVHEMQTRVADYKSRPSEDFVVSSNPDLQAQFRVRRNEVLEATPPAQPAQRTWVRLAEEEIHNLDPLPHQMFDTQRIKFARAIEAKLKEKNT
jgi:hypothetical protein